MKYKFLFQIHIGPYPLIVDQNELRLAHIGINKTMWSLTAHMKKPLSIKYFRKLTISLLNSENNEIIIPGFSHTPVWEYRFYFDYGRIIEALFNNPQPYTQRLKFGDEIVEAEGLCSEKLDILAMNIFKDSVLFIAAKHEWDVTEFRNAFNLVRTEFGLETKIDEWV